MTPWTAVCQASLSFTISWSLLKFICIESMVPFNHLILYRPLLLLPSIFPSIWVRVLSNESALCIRWPKYWSFRRPCWETSPGVRGRNPLSPLGNSPSPRATSLWTWLPLSTFVLPYGWNSSISAQGQFILILLLAAQMSPSWSTLSKIGPLLWFPLSHHFTFFRTLTLLLLTGIVASLLC